MKKLYIAALLALLYPAIAGACGQEEGVFAYVQNQKGRQPGAAVPAYKLAVAESVFRKLLNARGDFRMPEPELVMNDGQLYVAWMNAKKQQAGLEESAYDVCASFGADSLNALAALLAHELTHYYEKHDWTRHFSRTHANIEAAAQLGQLEEGLKLEVQSDYLGGFLALSAGFDTYGIIPRLLPKVYEAYLLPEEIPGYPKLSDRVAFANNAMERLRELRLAFGLGNCLTITGAYETAATYYNYILRDYQSRELYNNLGVLHGLAALNHFSKEEMPYILPLELDMQSRLGPGKRGFEKDTVKRAALLEEALASFERAELLDKEYPAAWINKACVYLLQSATEDAAYWARKAGKLSERLGLANENRDAQALLAIIAATEGEKEDAAAMLAPLAEAGYALALLNKAVLDGTAAAPLALFNFAKGVERIDGILLDDYLQSPAPELQVDMGGKTFCGLQRFANSEVLIHYANDGKQYALFHLTGEGYDGATRMGVRRGDSLEQVQEKYPSGHRTVISRQGAFLIFPNEHIIFRFDENGKADQWIVFRLQTEKKE